MTFDLNEAAKNLHNLQKVGEAMGLHDGPGLGSGALREALDAIGLRLEGKAFPMTPHDMAEPCVTLADYQAEAQALLAALSLSNPIEPAPCTKCEEAHRALDTYGIARGALGHSVRYRIGLLADEMRPTPQASSEIREAVTRETLEHWLRVVKSTLDPDGWDCDAPELRRMREQLETALAPSRQGAAKGVEG